MQTSNTDQQNSTNQQSSANQQSSTNEEASAKKQRLFRRFKSPQAATANPFPRPRDEHGESRNRVYHYNGVIPAKGALFAEYEQALELIKKHHRPMRSAALRDIIGRVDATIERHGTVVQEEEEALQLYNEDAAHAQAVVQTKIDELRRARAEREETEDTKCAECREELDKARTEYAAERAANGQPLPLINLSSPTMPDEKWLDTEEALAGIASATGQAVGALADGIARIAEAKASTVHGAAIAMQAAPAILREGGNFLSRFFGRGRSAPGSALTSPNASLAEIWTNEESGSAPLKTDIIFPIDTARQQAIPSEAHAHASGYPTKSAAASIARGNPVANFLALVTCGAIFGSSIGLLLGFIDPDAMQVAARQQMIVWGTCSAFGIALFYILGVTAETIFALIAEQYHAALVATHRKDPAAVGQWLRSAAIWTAWAGTAIFCLLIGIEAVVERYGIVQLAISRMSDAVMLGHVPAPKADLQGPAAIMIALIASVPFMCFHAARGWTHARLEVLTEATGAGQTHEAWALATQKYAEGLTELRSANRSLTEQSTSDAKHGGLNGILRLASEPGGARNGKGAHDTIGNFYTNTEGMQLLERRNRDNVPEAFSATSKGTAVLAAPGEAVESMLPLPTPLTIPLPIAEEAVIEQAQDAPEAKPLSRQALSQQTLEHQVSLARANEHFRECFIRLREAYRARREALQPFDTQVEQLQAMIVAERMEMTLEGKRRIEDVYADIIGAVQVFDQTYQEDLKYVERRMRGGITVQIRDWLFRPAG